MSNKKDYTIEDITTGFEFEFINTIVVVKNDFHKFNNITKDFVRLVRKNDQNVSAGELSKKYILEIVNKKGIEVLLGKTITDIEISGNKDWIVFTISDKEKYRMVHKQECSEGVYIEDINGDLYDLLNSPVLKAEKRSNKIDPELGTQSRVHKNSLGDNVEWTYYEIATIKGYVNFRWHGATNSCYALDVDFIEWI